MRKINNRYFKFVCAAAVVCVVGCANSGGGKQKSTKTDLYQGTTTSENDLQKHAEDRSLTISFRPGISDLSIEAQADMRNLVASIGTESISRVEIAAWSDKPFPRGKSSLSERDQNLAGDRAKKIDNFLNDNLDISYMRINTYNMAETSNWLARVMKTDGAELKSVFSKQSVAPMERSDFNMIAREGAPMKAVIVFVRK